GENFVDEREEYGNDAQGNDLINGLPKEGAAGHGRWGHVPAERRDQGADNERHHQEEADHEDHGEGKEAAADDVPDSGAGSRGNAEDGVEGILQFSEDAGGANEENDAADDDHEGASLGSGGVGKHFFNAAGGAATDGGL